MIETDRLLLRQWQDSDIPLFSDLNQDPAVMEFFPSTYSIERSKTFIENHQKYIANRGWGFWAVDIKASHTFIGMVGLSHVTSDLPITQTMEVGWRLAKEHWNKGYATEAALGSLNYAFKTLQQEAVVAFTPVQNKRSQRVMSKLGMQELADRFIHPRVPESSGLSEHVLYQITCAQYLASHSQNAST